ncbi:hypothetical protein MmiEs2_13880 [Methanimicrococcus stummii]|uniref:Uncharacterized protein n=1 Tax=Methanimicrococcus stummii TaxID=3028294 RepID=A0AA96ZXL7_9EURY|nr:hypothetical protein [Methanimicrococcus sp. Es2]WNY29165.1 hypothetical protein MmiEs2_13880 [Methanimicrococcus sp. Es2]
MIGILYLLGPIFTIILYSVLKKKYNFEMNVLLYGIGFTSCVSIFSVLIFRIPTADYIGMAVRFLYVIPFILLYYSYAILRTTYINGEKSINRDIIILTTAAAILSLFFILFEIMTRPFPYVGISLLLFGVYFAFSFICKKCVLSLRLLAWIPFLPAYVVLYYRITHMQIM